jgi:hypothetical protein
MKTIKEKSSHLVGFVKLNGQYIGSCIPFKIADKYYFITCGHVLYGENFENKLPPLEGIIVDVNNVQYSIVDLVGDKETSKKNDIAILMAKESDKDLEVSNFVETALCTPIEAPILISSNLFCFWPKKDSKESTIPVKEFDKNHNLNSYQVQVDKNVFYDIENGDWGARAYKGVSGSGLFFEYQNEVFLSGIVTDLESVTLTAQIRITASNALLDFFPNLIITDSSVFEEDNVLLSDALKECSEDVDSNTIKAWLNDNSNSNEVKRINRKINFLYPSTHSQKEKEKVVNNLLVGDKLIQYWKKNRPQIYRTYRNTNYALSQEPKLVYVTTRKEAANEYKKIVKEHKNDLFIDIANVSFSDKTLVTNRDIAQWLAICDLDFIKDE